MKLSHIAFSAILITGSFARAEQINCDFNLNGDVIKDKEKRLKTYTAQYWIAAENQIKSLPESLQKKGAVVGDFHFNNLGIYYDYPSNKAELIVNDFDDAGMNYLIGDLLKFLSYIKRVDKTIELNRLIEDYVNGLNGRENTAPRELDALLNRTQYEFAKDFSKYWLEKSAEAEEFDDSLMTDRQQSRRNHFAGLKLIKQLREVKNIFRVNDTGSSLDMERYEFVGTDQNGINGIIEFKQLKCSATGSSRTQDLVAQYDKTKAFYQKNFPSAYLSGQKIIFYDTDFFLVREKKNNPLKKLNIDKMNSSKMAEYAGFYANYLGRLHRPSADAAFTDGVTRHLDTIIRTVKKINDEFKDILK